MKIKKLILMSVVGLMALFWGNALFGNQVAMAGSYSDKLDLAFAKKNAPAGLPLSDYFEFGSFTTAYGGNSAQVVDTERTDGTQMVLMTSTTHQLGTIWTSDGYEWDLSKSGTASMWLFFGQSTSSAADGMAFVLQNDERGVDATSLTSDGKAGTGETMGVWGVDDAPSTDTAGIAGRAIQNSWALEFDTSASTQSLAGSAFDKNTGVSYSHIASGFPAQTGTYTGNSQYTILNHSGLISTNQPGMLATAQQTWHHVTLHWDAEADTMTYSFDDKSATDGSTKSTADTQTVNVDPSKLNVSAANPYVRWGFTGSTGDNSEVAAVVFEQLPGIANGEASASITDTTQGASVTSGTSVNANDHLRLDYKLTYDSGSKDWKDIVAGMNIPSSLTPTSAKVTYADGTVEEIGSDSTIGDVDLTNYKLKKSLNSDNNIATISVETVAVGSTSGTTSVAAAKSTFNGSNALSSATTPAFTIKKAPTTTLSMLFQDGTTAMNTSTTTVTGSFLKTGKPTKITLHPTLNGKVLPVQEQTDLSSFSYTLPVDESLNSGSNTLKLYATDDLGDVSNEVTATITQGDLDFGNMSDLTYAATLTGTSATLAPTSVPDINVDDTRGSGHHWTLNVGLKGALTATQASKTQGDYKGSLIYQDGEGNATPVTTATQQVDTGASGQVDVSQDWDKTWTNSKSHGMFLSVPSDATEGSYQGTLQWDLVDGPNS